MTTYKVSIDVRYDFEVEATAMDEALAKGICFQETMNPGWGDTQENTVSWVDSNIVKQTVSQDIDIG
jgi:hypothetical protein